MPKRKRELIEPSQREHAGHAQQHQRNEVERKLVHGKKRLNQALRTVRAFERQKLAKRTRAAEEEKDEGHIARLGRELEILKALDLPAVAETHLSKAISKTKTLSGATTYLTDLTKAEATSKGENAQDSERNNVLARLYNAKQVKSEVSSILNGIATTLGLDALDSNKARPQTRPKASEREPPKPALASTEWDGEGHDPEPEAISRNPSGLSQKALDGNSYARSDPNHPLAESSEVNTSSDEGEPDQVFQVAAQDVYDPSADLSLSPSGSERLSSTPPPTKSGTRMTNGSRPSNSAFLPSLMMSGYWSGSESAEDSIEEEKPRKNRRGQRARREIWEKKFGKTANHLKNGSRDSGWDPQKGATGGRDGITRPKGGSRDQNRNQHGPSRSGKAFSGTGANDVHVGQRSGAEIDDDKPLHPSWIAAKQAKQQKQTAAFQGKKLVFD